MNLKSFFTLNYLFDTSVIGLTRGDMVIFYFGIVSVLLSIVFKVAAVKAPTPIDKTFRAKLFNIFLTLGLSEIVWAGMRYQNVRFFGSRFVAWLVILICLVWMVVVLAKVLKNYSAEKEAWEKEQVKLKYLPK